MDVRLAVVPVQHDLDLNLTSLELTAAVLPEQPPLTRKPSTPTPPQASHGSRPLGPKSPIVTNTTTDAGSGAAICATDAVVQLSNPTSLSPSLSSGSGCLALPPGQHPLLPRERRSKKEPRDASSIESCVAPPQGGRSRPTSGSMLPRRAPSCGPPRRRRRATPQRRPRRWTRRFR